MARKATRRNTASAAKPDEHQVETDILIAGGGYAGLAASVAIKHYAPHLNVTVIDAAPEHVWQKDKRASAIAAAAENMLSTLGLWQDIMGDAQPINDMIVTDSNTADPVRPIYLTFDGKIDGNRPFAHMVPNRTMVSAMRERANQLDIDIIQSTVATGLQLKTDCAIVTTSTNVTYKAKLIVAADGVNSSLRKMAGIRTLKWQYGQSGIVTTVAHKRPHNGRAEEHFLPQGPFAILPLKGNRSSLVWTERTEDADSLIASDDLVFEIELERRFGHKLGEIKIDGGRKAFPLSLTLARDFIKQRLALIGDAAHGIHPIAGQGLNLGFKDVAALAETVIDADRLGLDFGTIDILERYQQWRRFDTVQMGVTTDVLNRLFSNDITPIRHMRDLGLGIVERLPALKSFFINQAAGTLAHQVDIMGEHPKLLKGHNL